ncbi:MAG: NAD-dependent epimerase/dehydratase family protein [Pseudomonadota bacterium]|nr:NAD-dependent epimerase/dehydratase family protein [Pseudomonadota bacterium]
MTTVFITGGSGFLGRNLIRECRARGHRVLALARSKQAQDVVASLGAEPVAADLLDVTSAQLGGSDWLIHAAAIVGEWGSRADYERINVAGTQHMLDVARAAGVQSFVLIGTEAAYATGGPMRNLVETMPLPVNPLPRYPATKAAAEKIVRAANAPGFRTTVVRPRLIWGRDDTSVLPQLVDTVNKGQFAWVDGGHYLTSTCHVANVCEGALLAAEKGHGGAAYFLTDGEPQVFREFMTRLFATRGVEVPDKNIPRFVVKLFGTLCEFAWEYLPIPGAPPITRMAIALGTQDVTVIDTLARREIGYVGRVSVEAGIAELQTQWTS